MKSTIPSYWCGNLVKLTPRAMVRLGTYSPPAAYQVNNKTSVSKTASRLSLCQLYSASQNVLGDAAEEQ